MRLIIVGGGEVRAVIFDGDLAAVVCLTCSDADMQRFFDPAYAVLDGVFDQRLQRQRRYAEERVRRVIFHDQTVLVQRLLHGEIGVRVLQFVGKRHGGFARDRADILPQVVREVQRDLLRFVRVQLAEVVNGDHGVVNEMRAHLQHHDACALMGDLALVARVLLYVIRDDQNEHDQREERHTEYNE